MNKAKTGKWVITFVVAAFMILSAGLLQASSELGTEIEETVNLHEGLTSPIDSGSQSNFLQLCGCGHGHDGDNHDGDNHDGDNHDCDHDHDCDNYEGCDHDHGHDHDKDHKKGNDK